MKVVRYACGNVDSCTPGTTHLYPVPGETVTIQALPEGWTVSVHVRGEDDDLEVPTGAAFIVAYVEAEMHCIGATLLDGREVLIPIDDLDWPEDLTIIRKRTD